MHDELLQGLHPVQHPAMNLISLCSQSLFALDLEGAIQAAARQLGEARNGSDHRAIKQAMERLESVSTAYVDRRMNANIQKAMAGHAVDEFK